MIRMLPVFRSAKNTRPSEARAGAIGQARLVCTGVSCTGGLFGLPPPGGLNTYQTNAKVARIATAATTTASSIKRGRGCTEPERTVLLRALSSGSFGKSHEADRGPSRALQAQRKGQQQEWRSTEDPEIRYVLDNSDA